MREGTDTYCASLLVTRARTCGADSRRQQPSTTFSVVRHNLPRPGVGAAAAGRLSGLWTRVTKLSPHTPRFKGLALGRRRDSGDHRPDRIDILYDSRLAPWLRWRVCCRCSGGRSGLFPPSLSPPKSLDVTFPGTAGPVSRPVTRCVRLLPYSLLLTPLLST